MRAALKPISFLALIVLAGAPALYLADAISKDTMTTFMLAGTVTWFATVGFWMDRKPPAE